MNNSEKIILDLCGGTGSWSKPYKDAGYDVRLVTLPEFDIRQSYQTGGLATKHEYHSHDDSLCFPYKLEYKKPKKEVMVVEKEKVYGILAAPPCTMFAFSRTKAKKHRDLGEGMECIRACLDIIWGTQECQQATERKVTNLKFWALENPYFSFVKYFLGKPVFTFDPWEFGDGYQKRTALWGNFNEPKKSPVPMTTEMRGLAKTNSYLHKLPVEKGNRHLFNALKLKYPKFGSDKTIEFRFNAAVKSITPAGFAKAFFLANQ